MKNCSRFFNKLRHIFKHNIYAIIYNRYLYNILISVCAIEYGKTSKKR